jgi:hypothetical protein
VSISSSSIPSFIYSYTNKYTAQNRSKTSLDKEAKQQNPRTQEKTIKTILYLT